MNLPDFRLDGKAALITGAGRGIGAAIAAALAAAGCAVAIQDIELPVAQAVADNINSAGGRAIALPGDIQDMSLARQLVEQTVAQFNGLHILINNAAIQSNGIHWTKLTVDELQQKYRANVIAPMLLMHQAVPLFQAAKHGRIINIGSVQQRHGSGNSVAYSMTKAALWNMTTTMALELARTGITVNMISPGWFNTYRNREDFPTPDDLKKNGQQIPNGRIGEPHDCAGAALMLCSPAGAYITGTCLFIDGGLTA